MIIQILYNYLSSKVLIKNKILNLRITDIRLLESKYNIYESATFEEYVNIAEYFYIFKTSQFTYLSFFVVFLAIFKEGLPYKEVIPYLAVLAFAVLTSRSLPRHPYLALPFHPFITR